MKELLSALFPPDIPAVARWRLTLFAFAMVVLFHIAWVCGWLTIIGLDAPFAKADMVKTKIDEAVTPIKNKLDESQSTLNAIAHQLTQTISTSKASEIRVLATKRCIAKPYEKESLNKEIDVKQEEYLGVKGQYYTIPECNDLR